MLINVTICTDKEQENSELLFNKFYYNIFQLVKAYGYLESAKVEILLHSTEHIYEEKWTSCFCISSTP